ncbi:AAA family ATPase [Candidatus Dependentiae bacterium]|jgi:shikimate kinase|nr:AAA family ATPase [Candidatus Dependentiae bacterium]
MKLIVLYGPPAAGKLTIARELEKLTSFRVMDMNLTLAAVTQLFPMGTPRYRELNRSFRGQLLESAAQDNLPGVILTHGYSHHDNAPFIQSLIDLMERYNGEINFVYVTCPLDELEKRIALPSRKQHVYKVNDIQTLRDLLKRRSFPQIPFVKNLVIDSSTVTPEQAAQKIFDYISHVV